ncbi:MAG: hypothetical protein ACD_2C00271G0002 [uncultured bacterium (gcode 4)]|uniref:Right handed beta helix domain-containing protein n=1 Tax=uncultured bacterium (gcode 4) TaxID=1234023 RepID=K2G0Y1_9BACT|nr:MAG: hypothetical protein ACD_2C00271G0002 [uncultured bacterium (gcode 4)]
MNILKKSEKINCQIKAFTLVELIVVILILAILATIAFISFSSQSWSARDSTRLSDMTSLKKWFEMYSISSGKYPTPDNFVSVVYSWGVVWNQWVAWEGIYKLIQKTLSKKVSDPLTEKDYNYSLASNNKEFQLAGNFENTVSLNGRFSPFDSVDKSFALGWTGAYVYITWNYNWVLLKVFTWSTYYFVPTPTLFWLSSSWADTVPYDDSFGSWVIYLPWINNFAEFDASQIYSTWGTKLTSTDILNLMQELQQAYSWSNVSTPAIMELQWADSSDLLSIWNWLLGNALWWSAWDWTAWGWIGWGWTDQPIVADFYVSKTGNNSNSWTINSPKLTIWWAISAIWTQTWKTVFVSAWTYIESVTLSRLWTKLYWESPSGTIITSSGTNTVAMNAIDQEINWFTLENTWTSKNVVSTSTSSWSKITNIIINAWPSWKWVNISSSDNLSIIWNVINAPTNGYWIYASSSAWVNIRNNKIHWAWIISIVSITNLNVINNHIAYSAYWFQSNDGAMTSWSFIGNTFVGNDTALLIDSNTIKVYNNIFAYNSFAAKWRSPYTSWNFNTMFWNWTNLSNYTLWANDRIEDPLFEANWYYDTLSNWSPAIDSWSGTAASLWLDSYTVRADWALDSGTADRWYHRTSWSAFAPIQYVKLYVSKSWNDTTWDGSSWNPYLTIQKAINVSKNYHEVNVWPWIYSETIYMTSTTWNWFTKIWLRLVWENKDTTSIANTASTSVTMSVPLASISGFTIGNTWSSKKIIHANVPFARISGNKINTWPSWQGIDTNSANSLDIVGNTITSPSWATWINNANSPNVKIRNNQIFWWQTWIQNGAGSNNIYLFNNYIANLNTWYNGDADNTVWNFVNNTFSGATGYGLVLHNNSLKVYNNIFINCYVWARWNSSAYTGWSHNTFYNITSPMYYTAWVQDITQNPLFEAGTNKVQSWSPTIDSGSGTAASLWLDGLSTRFDVQLDTWIVDRGYHQ